MLYMFKHVRQKIKFLNLNLVTSLFILHAPNRNSKRHSKGLG